MIDPVGSACNLRCKYCYQDPVRSTKTLSIMPYSLLEKLIRETIDLDTSILRFLWHGGEPLLAGLDFFKTAYHLQQKYKKPGQIIENHVQTNATLIDEKWADFLCNHHFQIGTSIDGPKNIHNITRSNSFRKTVSGIKHIKQKGRSVGIIITINKINVIYPEEIWRELIVPKELATSWDVNICSSTETSAFTPKFEQAVSFLNRLFDLWFQHDDPEIYIKTFWIAIRALVGGRPNDCAFEYNKCRHFLAIDEKGNVYPCNRFLKREFVYLGNIEKQNLIDILNSTRAKQIYLNMSRLKPECKNCKWLFVCGGGCAFQRWLDSGTFDGDFLECGIRKEFFSHVETAIKKRGRKRAKL